MVADLRRNLAAWVAVGACLALVSSRHVPLGAADPRVRFQELLAGANGDSRIQFLTFVAEGAGSTCWGPQVAPGTAGADDDDSLCYQGGPNETRSRTALVFFDRLGRETGRYLFPENPPASAVVEGSRPVRTNPRRDEPSDPVLVTVPRTILVATSAFAALERAPAPDFVMPPLLNAIAGKVCFVGNVADNPNAPALELCVSYGDFAGDTAGGGPPAAPLPIVDTVSLRRADSGFENRNASFVRTTTPRPSSGVQAFLIPRAPLTTQGETLFRREAFGGNGRTCDTCHPSHDSGRLTPGDVQARFATLAATFDSLFIAETASTGFDFNLNTLTIAARPQPASGTDFMNASGGDLQRMLTAANGARAKVVGRVAPTTYLVYGGVSPRLSGTVTDEAGNRAAVVSVTQGGLNTLEEPLKMRTSRSTAFRDGRALILENRDEFTNPPVFRKSPHILNLSRTAPFGFDGRTADLQTFTLEAVRQHFPRTLARLEAGPNPDFRMPTSDELAAMTAFQLAQEFPRGTDPNKFNLDRFVTTPAQQRGRDFFFGRGKCSFCHGGPVLATTTVPLLGQLPGINGRFNTGVARLPINGAGVDNLPCEPTVGACASREFSVPTLFNVANHAPFFHDGSAATLRAAIDFYNSGQFAGSPAGNAVGGILVTPQNIEDVVAFFEAISESGAVPLTGSEFDNTATSATEATTRAPQMQPSVAGLAPVPRTTMAADGVRLTATAIARGLSLPDDLAADGGGRIFIAERTGRIRVVRDSRLLPEPAVSIQDFDARGGTGILSIALDPQFSRTSLLYALYTASTGYRLARYRIQGDTAAERAVLIDRIGPASAQPSAVVRFGPDAALYVAIDDGGDAGMGSSLASYSGKVLRLNADATTPRDQASPIYATDIRQPRGLDWDDSGRLWVMQPDALSAYAREDPAVPRLVRVAQHSVSEGTSATALVVYRSSRVPQLSNDVLIGSSQRRGLLRLRSDAGRRSAPLAEWLFPDVVAIIRAMVAAPDGAIYVATADTLVRLDARPPER